MTGPDRGMDTTPPVQQTAPDDVVLDINFDIDSLYGLRAAITAHADDLGLPADIADHLLIVASEQAINAIRHGGGRGRLRLWRDLDLLYCEVSDSGPGIANVRLGLTQPDPEVTSGRGLWLIRRLTHHVVITATGNGSVVTAVLSVPDQ